MRGSWPAARWLVACWTVVGTVGFGYLFACSTLPVTTTGDPAMLGPAWLQSVALVAALFVGLPVFFLPVLWLPTGVRYLRRAGFNGRCAGWIAGSAAALVVEIAVILGVGVRDIAPSYAGAPIVSWVELAESAAFLVIGVALAAIVRVSTQRGR
jgi:hypothetical protein